MQYAILIGVLILSMSVLLVTISISLRPRIAVLNDFWSLPIPPWWQNYRWTLDYLTAPMITTLGIISVSIVSILIFACPAAYTLARLSFPGRRIIILAILAFTMIPPPILLTPNFILANQWGLKGTVHGLILFYIGGGLSFAILLMTLFLRSQEQEIFEAARIDGATEPQTMWHIALPLSKSVIVTVMILNFMSLYSDLIWPSLMLPANLGTVMMALSKLSPMNGAASFIVASIPQFLIFAVAMKYFTGFQRVS